MAAAAMLLLLAVLHARLHNPGAVTISSGRGYAAAATSPTRLRQTGSGSQTAVGYGRHLSPALPSILYGAYAGAAGGLSSAGVLSSRG